VGRSLYSPKCAPEGHLEMEPRHLSEHIIVALDGAHFTWPNSRTLSFVQHEALATGARFSLRPGDQADAGENGLVLLFAKGRWARGSKDN
jgi:hypothetical protein